MEERSIDDRARQSKAFKQRVSYWLTKGLPAEEAYRRACVRNQLLALAPPPEPAEAYVERSVVRKADQPKACAESLPSEIQTGRESVTPHADFSPSKSGTLAVTQPRSWLSGNLEGALATDLASRAMETVFCGAVVLGASILLVESSAQVFGQTPQGWAKAILLELGILGLSIYRSQTILEWTVSKLGALALVLLSVSVLHAGVKNSEASTLKEAESSSADLRALEEDRTRLLALHDSLPQDHISRREGIMREIRRLGDQVQPLRARISTNSTAKAIERSHQVEALMRLALIFLNVVFAHRLAERLRGVDLGMRRGEAMGSG